jgi:hypothetical protein
MMAIGLIAIACLALAGCGRRSDPSPIRPQAAQTPAPPSAATAPDLLGSAVPIDRTRTPRITRPQQPFVLDPLL